MKLFSMFVEIFPENRITQFDLCDLELQIKVIHHCKHLGLHGSKFNARLTHHKASCHFINFCPIRANFQVQGAPYTGTSHIPTKFGMDPSLGIEEKCTIVIFNI